MTSILMPDRRECVVLILDMAPEGLAGMPRAAALERQAEALVRGARILGVPVIASVLDGQALTARLGVAIDAHATLPRSTFSALAEAAVASRLAAEGRPVLVLAGLETHGSVQQTALAALAMGYRVTVVRDATASRLAELEQIAEARMRQAGVVMESAASLLLALCERPGTPEQGEIAEMLA